MQLLEQIGYATDSVKAECVDEVSQIAFQTLLQICPSPTSTHFPTGSTGNLRDSHQIVRIDGQTVSITPMAFYAIYVHEGHFSKQGGSFVKSSTGSYVFVPPKPWIQMTADTIRQQVNDLVRDKIVQALYEAAFAASAMAPQTSGEEPTE